MNEYCNVSRMIIYRMIPLTVMGHSAICMHSSMMWNFEAQNSMQTLIDCHVYPCHAQHGTEDVSPAPTQFNLSQIDTLPVKCEQLRQAIQLYWAILSMGKPRTELVSKLLSLHDIVTLLLIFLVQGAHHRDVSIRITLDEVVVRLYSY